MLPSTKYPLPALRCLCCRVSTHGRIHAVDARNTIPDWSTESNLTGKLDFLDSARIGDNTANMKERAMMGFTAVTLVKFLLENLGYSPPCNRHRPQALTEEVTRIGGRGGYFAQGNIYICCPDWIAPSFD
jgi:hypothetical protein